MGIQKAVVRTVRMQDDIEVGLQRFAEEQGLSVNALVCKVLRKYVEWDALVNKFGWIQNASQFEERIMTYLTDEDACEFGKWAGSVLAKEYVGFWFKDLNFENFLRGIRLLAAGAGHFRLEEQNEKGTLIIICHHGRGPKWSLFYRELFKVSFDELCNLKIDVDFTDNQVVLRVPLDKIQSRNKPVAA
jgi:hypothetical protein